MRNLFFLVGFCFQVFTPNVRAQDQSEYIHWDAASLEAYHDQLSEQLRDNPDSGLAFTDALARSDARLHYVQIIHRSGYSRPENHATLTDVYVILGGSGTLIVGGERVDWVDGQPAASQTPRIEGGQRFQIAKGDMINVPFGTWHQTVLEPGETVTYAIIKIIEEEG
jgi:mannose-6-phosphate isomerase-like protein (cupin superfamily)